MIILFTRKGTKGTMTCMKMKFKQKGAVVLLRLYTVKIELTKNCTVIIATAVPVTCL